MNKVIPAVFVLALVWLYVVITWALIRKIGSWRKWESEEQQGWWMGTVMIPILFGCTIFSWVKASGQ